MKKVTRKGLTKMQCLDIIEIRTGYIERMIENEAERRLHESMIKKKESKQLIAVILLLVIQVLILLLLLR